MAWPFIVICLRRRVAAPVAEVANALRAAGLDWQLAVSPSIGVAVGMGSR
jgi:hypothetical protein